MSLKVVCNKSSDSNAARQEEPRLPAATGRRVDGPVRAETAGGAWSVYHLPRTGKKKKHEELNTDTRGRLRGRNDATRHVEYLLDSKIRLEVYVTELLCRVEFSGLTC